MSLLTNPQLIPSPSRRYSAPSGPVLSPTKRSNGRVFETPQPRTYLPFSFGAEFEIIIRPRANMIGGSPLPDHTSTTRAVRDAGLAILSDVARHLSAGGMPCKAHDDTDEPLDYSEWSVMMDGSLSKGHCRDGFYPVEVITPIIAADENWPSKISRFFDVMLQGFEFRRNTSCGFHIHVSTATNGYSLDQLRMMAKAVCFWEPAATRCAPPSRQDRINPFCNSNIKSRRLRDVLHEHGPHRGLCEVYRIIDGLSTRDDVVGFICEDNYRAWNFLPGQTGKAGSIEFRRAPGVVSAKKAMHWIAFVLSFVEMAMQCSPVAMITRMYLRTLDQFWHPDFEEQLLASARAIDVYFQLEPRLQQTDEPRSSHISMMPCDDLRYLQALDPDYGHPRT